LIDRRRLLGQGCAGGEHQRQQEHRARHAAGNPHAREMEMCLFFTGLEPCAEHTYWCGPSSPSGSASREEYRHPRLLKI